MKKTILLILLSMVLLCGCGVSDTKENTGATLANEDHSISDSKEKTGSMELSYATGFSVDYYGDDALIGIGDEKYYLTEDAKEADIPDDAQVIHAPVKNIYLASSSAMDLFLQIDTLDDIAMTSTDAKDWTIEKIASSVDAGTIEYVGKYSAPDFERILDRGCDLAIENTMIWHQPKTREQLIALGVPTLVETSSYEEHVLGRMEWVKLYGLLTGHEDEAESYFSEAEERLKRVSDAPDTKKSVSFFYITSSGYVNVRKSGDYISELIEMAGGHYVSCNEDEENNLSTMNVDIESFVESAHGADVLIYNSTVSGAPDSVDDLIGQAPFLAGFKAIETGEVWSTGQNMFQMTGSMPEVAEELAVVISGGDESGLSFFKKLK